MPNSARRKYAHNFLQMPACSGRIYALNNVVSVEASNNRTGMQVRDSITLLDKS